MNRIPPKKSLGQHFLSDPGILRKITALCVPEPGSGLCEVGPGTGNLTAHLLDVVPHLVAIERDPRMRLVLQERFGAKVTLHEADAADVDWPAILADLGPQPVVCGNLPYYAAMPILFSLMESRRRPARIVAMLQKEVADRLVARPSTPDYGQVSVKLQLLADIRIAFGVKPGSFSPPPKVDSAVVVMTPLAAPRFDVPDLPRFSSLVTAGFGVRRKTLANALQVGLALPPDTTRAALRGMGIDERVRGEALTVAQWTALARALPRHAVDAGVA